MKKVLSILITLVAFSFNMNADNIADAGRCRLVNFKPAIFTTDIERSESDLLSGIWILGSSLESDVNQKFIFEKGGKLLIFNETTERGITVDEKKWKLVDFEGEVYLALTDVHAPKRTVKDELYKISQTCDGMELKHIKSGKMMVFDYKTLKQAGISQRDVAGEWMTTQYPFDIAQRFDQPGTFEPVRGAFVKLDLNEDGSYTKSFGGEVKTFTENGTWSLSRDGKYIVLSKDRKKFGESNLEAIEIQKLNSDKLVVRSSIHAESLTSYTTGTKLFYFTRKS